MTTQEFWEKVNNFSGVEILIGLDFDDGTDEQYNELITKLKHQGRKFIAYKTDEGRCRHIHIFTGIIRKFSKHEREKLKNFIINKFECDGLKASEHANMPIAYPAPEGHEPKHWKTQQPIKVVFSNVR